MRETVLTPDDVAPIPRIGPDTRDRWLVRDVPRGELEGFLNAASALGWELSECYVLQDGDPPVTAEVLRVWCSAKVPKIRAPRATRAAVPHAAS
jgi:hypothetical protein